MAPIPLLLWTFLERPGTTPVRVRGGRIRRGRSPIRRAPPNQLSSLPSPVDAFHRPQAPAPPHVTTPHERAPGVDGTGISNQSRNKVSRTFFRDARRQCRRFFGRLTQEAVLAMMRRCVGRNGLGPEGQCPPRNHRSAPMPSLENLKKQAKLVLRWHREGYFPVAQRIRLALPRHARSSDAAILGGRFTLAEAQELIARERGFQSWQALRSGLATMNDHADRAEARRGLSPALRVRRRGVLHLLYRKARLRGRLRLWRAALLRAGAARPRPLQPAPRRRPRLRRRGPRTGGSSVGLHHGRANQATLPRAPLRRRAPAPAPEEAALGGRGFHRQGPGREPDRVRQPDGSAGSGKCHRCYARRGSPRLYPPTRADLLETALVLGHAVPGGLKAEPAGQQSCGDWAGYVPPRRG